MKSLTSLFGTILDIKKEIMKGIKTEIDLRKSLTAGEEDSDLMEAINVESIADKLESLRLQHDIQKNKRLELRTKGEKHVRIDK